MFLECLIDIDQDLLYIIDNLICEYIHIYDDDGDNKIDIIIRDEYMKYFETRFIYETFILEYDEILRKNICSIEKTNMIRIYKSSSYEYIENDIYDEKVGIDDINAILSIDEYTDKLYEKFIGHAKFPILTLKFKDKKQLAKFKILK